MEPKPKKPLSPSQLAQRVQAGKASYKALVAKLLQENTVMSDDDRKEVNWDRLAQRLSCIRWNRKFRHRRGLTSDYCKRWCIEHGLWSDDLKPPG